MSALKQFLDQVCQFPWFLPNPTIMQKDIETQIKQHLARLKPFGLQNSFPCRFVKIWPGELPADISTIHKQTRQSLVHAIVDNLVGIIREVALNKKRMSLLDSSMRETSSTVKGKAKESAIQVAGLTVKATISIDNPVYAENGMPTLPEISDFDIVEMAAQDAEEIFGWYVAWQLVSDHFEKDNYKNPFTPLLELWKLGLWPVGISKDHFVILVPGGRRVKIVAPGS